MVLLKNLHTTSCYLISRLPNHTHIQKCYWGNVQLNCQWGKTVLNYWLNVDFNFCTFCERLPESTMDWNWSFLVKTWKLLYPSRMVPFVSEKKQIFRLFDLCDKYLAKNELKEKILDVYFEFFGTNELINLIGFYSTQFWN